ncbi:MAG: prepilin-type N-terminal cleavage/methylation domain-containing protein [Opitutus sp.]
MIRWSSSEAGRDRTAFTLIEILLAVGLIGLLAAAMVTVATHVADGKPRTARDIFWEATRTARRTALQSETDVRLTYDAKEKAFLVDAGGNVKKFPVPETRELTIDLLQAQTSGGSILIGGQLVDTRTLASVSFYSDGTCTPFRIQFRTTGPARIESIDPWTCAPVLPDPKKT